MAKTGGIFFFEQLKFVTHVGLNTLTHLQTSFDGDTQVSADTIDGASLSLIGACHMSLFHLFSRP